MYVLLVRGDVGGVVVVVAGKVLVIERSVSVVHVGCNEVVLVLLVDEADRGLVDEHLLSRQVVSVALGLVELGVRLLNERVVAAQRRAAPVEAMAGPAGEDVEPVLLVRVVGAPSVG